MIPISVNNSSDYVSKQTLPKENFEQLLSTCKWSFWLVVFFSKCSLKFFNGIFAKLKYSQLFPRASVAHEMTPRSQKKTGIILCLIKKKSTAWKEFLQTKPTM